MSSVVVPAFVTKASKSSRNAPRKPKIWRLKSFVQGCVALFFPGYSSIISFPNLVDQGERYHNISEKFLALVNALTRHGPGPEDNMSVNLARKAASSIPGAHRPAVPRVGSAVPPSVQVLTSRPCGPQQLQTGIFLSYAAATLASILRYHHDLIIHLTILYLLQAHHL